MDVHADRPIARSGYAILSAAVLFAVWKLFSVATASDIILPPPEKVARVFFGLFAESRFLAALGATCVRGLWAFGLSMLIGGITGFASGASRRINALLGPALLIIRATPVLAIILLALIWFPSGTVPVFSAVIMAFPVVMADVAQGIGSADPKLVQMARLFGMNQTSIAMRVRLPSALPHIVAAAKSALGLSWKVVIAGEVLSQPQYALGTGMQSARVMLETTEVFAWAAAGIVLCALSDAAFALLARRFSWTTV